MDTLLSPLAALWASHGATIAASWVALSLGVSAVNEGVRRARATGWRPSPALAFLLGMANGAALNLDKVREAVLWARGLGLLPAGIVAAQDAQAELAKEKAGREAAEEKARLLAAEVERLRAGGAK